MTMDEFKSAASSSIKEANNSVGLMTAFGGKPEEPATPTEEETLEDTFDNFDNDFSDDFSDDFDDFDDFDEPEPESESESESLPVPEPEPELINPSIASVTIATKDVEVTGGTGILAEIREFLEYHRFNTEEYPDDRLFKAWASIYNIAVYSNEECIESYLKVHYGLWFDSVDTMRTAVDTGLYKSLTMHRRVCTYQDVQMFNKKAGEDWFNPLVIDRYSNDSTFNQPLCDLMKEGKVNEEVLDEFVGNTLALMCCIRLLLDDKFNLVQFRNAVENGSVVDYTNETLNDSSDRFACIRGRDDFATLYSIVTTSENCGHAIRQEILEKYADAAHLDVILRVESQSRLDESFADAYLIKPLGQYKFIADIYEKGTIDLDLDRSVFVRAKVLTDARKLDLDLTNFKPEYQRAMMCLVVSRFVSGLSEVDYKKFLALCSLDNGEVVLGILQNHRKPIVSYNRFWFEELLKEKGLTTGEISDKVEDNILYVQRTTKVRRKYYLEIDDFVLNTADFKTLVKDAQFAAILPDNKGLLLSNENTPVTVANNLYFAKSGSLTTWASGLLDHAVVQQFKQYNPIVHANFLHALTLANKQIAEENESTKRSLSSTVLDFLKMNLSEYYRYDKVFDFIVEHPIYLGLFTARKAYDLLCLFSNVYVYKSDAKRMFMFLYSICHKFYPEKLKLYSAGFDTLDADKSLLFVKGMNPNIGCLNFKVVIDSLDTVLAVADQSREITLYVENQTINIEF